MPGVQFLQIVRPTLPLHMSYVGGRLPTFLYTFSGDLYNDLILAVGAIKTLSLTEGI